ncbi:MAG: AbrB/MazE/SpoVT family DNA-binding domain-containing protein [Candidatus Schekmanbacteria bacterium]|nr:AbrB/MazE/SpoVT family DNA-binding domain-containing protein [Candidatus Schekmanbacteria bacterium]
MSVTSIDRFGRIVIPKDLREALALSPGTSVSVERRGDGLVVERVHASPILVKKDGVLLFTGEAAGDLEQALELDRKSRLNVQAAGTY